MFVLRSVVVAPTFGDRGEWLAWELSACANQLAIPGVVCGPWTTRPTPVPSVAVERRFLVVGLAPAAIEVDPDLADDDAGG